MEDDERRGTVTLRPHNPDFEPIELTVTDEDDVTVIAAFVKVLGSTQ